MLYNTMGSMFIKYVVLCFPWNNLLANIGIMFSLYFNCDEDTERCYYTILYGYG